MKSKIHVLVYSYPVFGHIIPHLRLAETLSQHDLEVTFLVSNFCLPQIHTRNLLPMNVALIGLPDNVTEATDVERPTPTKREDVSTCMREAVVDFFYNLPSAGDSGSDCRKDASLKPVDVVVCDSFCYLAVEQCHRRGIPCHIFSTPSAVALSTMMALTETAPTVSNEVFFASSTPEKKTAEVGGRQLSDSNKRFMLACNDVVRLARSVIINSFSELEPAAIADLHANPKSKNVPLHFIGPLLSSPAEKDAISETFTHWLDSKDPGSVVYLAFGSMALFTRELTADIAKALLAIGKPFIWALPASQIQFLPDELKVTQSALNAKPDGQFIVAPWVPQRLILAHPATRVFVTHAGWNGALESIVAGVPMLFWPFFGDANVNADALVREKLGIRIAGTGMRSARAVSAEEFGAAVSTVAGWSDDGNDYYGNAQKWSRIARDAQTDGGSSRKGLFSLLKSFRGDK